VGRYRWHTPRLGGGRVTRCNALVAAAAAAAKQTTHAQDSTMSFSINAGFVGSTLYLCGEPVHPHPGPSDALRGADDLARHGDQAVAPLLSAHGAPSSGRLEQVALNPQPLPPREKGFGSLTHIDDWCGTVPKHLPPHPPTPLGSGLQFSLQTLMSDYQQAESLAGNVQKKVDDALGTIAARI
jgi:hypothetical protein